MLPTFLGIGAPKAGTTWVYELLRSHPNVKLSRRKEVHFFDLHHERGVDWYARFFSGGEGFAAIGEFTPTYLYDPDVPARVREMGTPTRFILTLRDPVERAYSHYRFRVRQDNTSESFDAFLAREPNAIEWGKYGSHLEHWLATFAPDQFLVLVFEHAVRDAAATRTALARHLAVDPAGFPDDAGATPANDAFVPRRRGLYAAAVRRARWLRRHDLDGVIDLARRAGIARTVRRAAGNSAAADGVDAETKAALWPRFEADVEHLEQLTGLNLTAWRPQ